MTSIKRVQLITSTHEFACTLSLSPVRNRQGTEAEGAGNGRLLELTPIEHT